MLNFDTSRLEKRCRALVKAFQSELNWEWDDRFETVLAAFDVKIKDQVHAHIHTMMENTWDEKNAQDAPHLVQMIMTHFGGMEKGQRLFTTDPNVDDILLCAWWPWGNGNTISIRIGVYVKGLNDEDNTELSRLSKGWFHL